MGTSNPPYQIILAVHYSLKESLSAAVLGPGVGRGSASSKALCMEEDDNGRKNHESCDLLELKLENSNNIFLVK